MAAEALTNEKTAINADVGEGIRVRGLSKRYQSANRSIAALDGLDLTIETSGFHAVMGTSGSGKSTLLHLLAGLDRADAGTIAVAGVQVDQLTEKELTLYRRKTVGVVFQQFNLLPTLTACENVALPGVLDSQPRATTIERAEALLAELGLTDRADHRPDALSGGEQQRVAIARALYFDPPVLLADEPTGNLDSISSSRLWSTLGDITHARQLIVLMVTHEADAAARCQDVCVLRDGQLAGTFDVEGLDPSELAARAQEFARPAG